MKSLNSALASAHLYAVSRAKKIRSDQGMSTIEYALVQHLQHLACSTARQNPRAG